MSFCYFKINGDRAYLITVDGECHTITFGANVIEGLTKLNQPERRAQSEKDKSFIKAMLISVCKLDKIQSLRCNEKLPKEMINFIKSKIS